MSTVRFNPLDLKSKSTLGAVKMGEVTKFSLEFSRPSNPEHVYMLLTKDGEDSVRYELDRKSLSPEGFVLYSLDLTVNSSGLYHYIFEVECEKKITTIGCGGDLTGMLTSGVAWQLTVYDDAVPAPTWAKGGVFYQIMPDRFFIGGDRLKTKDKAKVVYRNDWDGIPVFKPDENGKILNNDFFGGNLRGIIKKLGYLKSLGISCIYLNPIFEARSNHKYDTGHYRKIDPDFGTADDLKELIKKADKRGMKIMLDGVFSHTGDDSIYFNKYGNYDSLGAFQSKDSPYKSWYSFSDHPNFYESWWGIDTLPNVKEENPAYLEYINGEDGIIKYWTDFGLGGWRLDVADELPDVFLEHASRAAKSKSSEVMMLGEVWEDASNKVSYSYRRKYLQGKQLDSVTNYPFKEDILHFVRTADAKKLAHTVNVILNNYPTHTVNNLMNLLATHDTVRLATSLGDSGDASTREKRAKAKLLDAKATYEKVKLASVLQFTLPGNPCVYYGDEVGLQGFEDPFNRRTYPWDNLEKDNKAVLKHYRRLGKIRLENKAVFSDGTYKLLTDENGIFAFERVGNKETIVTIVNNSDIVYEFETKKEHTDLLTNKPYAGKVASKSAVVLKLTSLIPVKNIKR